MGSVKGLPMLFIFAFLVLDFTAQATARGFVSADRLILKDDPASPVINFKRQIIGPVTPPKITGQLSDTQPTAAVQPSSATSSSSTSTAAPSSGTDGSSDDDDEYAYLDLPPDDDVPGMPITNSYDAQPDEAPKTDAMAPCDGTYADMSALDAVADTMPDNCKTLYTVQTLQTMLNGALTNYTDMMKNGYDGKFKTYADSVADNAGGTVSDWVTKNGNKYFTCIIPENSVCCDYCKNGAHPANQCNYCFTDQSCTHQPTSVIGKRLTGMERRESVGAMGGQQPVTTFVLANHTEPCPPDYSQRGYGPDNPYEQSIYWSLNADKSDSFYSDILSDTGIEKKNIKFGNTDRGNDCAPSAKPDDDCWGMGYDYNIPQVSGYSADDVTNPKDLFTKALSNATDLGQQLNSVIQDIQANVFMGDGYDLIDALTLPVFMIVEATENMATVDTVADKIDAEKKKAIILAVLGAILFFIPIVGEVAGSLAEVGDLAAIISALGTAGNVAMDIYTVVKDPANAPLAILGLIMAPLAIADVAAITKAAGIRRGMADDDIAKLGTTLAARMGTIKKITGGKCMI